MIEKRETRSDNPIKKEAHFFNKDLAIFSFFLFLSFIFWYLNALGKDIEAEIRYPVQYVNPPKGKLITEEQPVRLNLFLKGSGYTILKLKLTSNKTPFIIDISGVSYKRVPGSKNLNYFIVTSAISKNLTSKLRSDCEVTSVKPDTLFFTLNETPPEYITVDPDD